MSTIYSAPAISDPAVISPNFSQVTAGLISTTVPDGVCGVTATVAGAGGASSSVVTGVNGGLGAGGAIIGAKFKVLPQQAITGTVASGGIVSTATVGTSTGGTGASAGGNGGIINSTTIHRGGGGGGSSAISIGGIKLIQAGGGGGGGGAHQTKGFGGSGGFAGIAAGTVAVGVIGTAGQQATGTVAAGQGGQALAGGAGGLNSTTASENGSAGAGVGTGTGGNGGTDTGTDSGGGGGGGYTGGGGGAATNGDSQSGGGGGGGSSYVAANSPTVAASAPTTITGAGAPQTVAGPTNGATGAVTLNWVPCLYTLNVAKTASPTTVSAGDRTVWAVTVTNTGPDPMTRGDTITLTDTLPGPVGSISPAYKVLSISTSGGSNADLANGAVTCSGVTVGSAMPASTTCSRSYSAPSAPGAPNGGLRGLNAGESITITYEQVFPNTAACTTITNTATVVDRSNAGSTTSRTASTPVTLNCYDLGITKSVSPTVAGAGNTLTWTMNVTNNGLAAMNGPVETAANPLIVTDAAPTINVSGPIAFTSTGPAGVCTYASPTVTCPTGLSSGQSQTFTFQQTVNVGAANGSTVANTASVTDPKTGDSNDTQTAAVTLQANLTLVKTVTNDNGGTQLASSYTLKATGPTTLSGSTGTPPVSNIPVAAGTYVLSETGPTTGYLGTWSCPGVALTGGNTFTIAAGQGVTCTINNNDIAPSLKVTKTSIGSVGTFNFSGTNGYGTDAITTTLAGTAVNGIIKTLTLGSVFTTLTETIPPGYAMTAASCTGIGAGLATPDLAAGTITLDAAATALGNNIQCSITNSKLPTITITKVSTGATGAFSFTGSNGFSNQTITTTTSGVGAVGLPQTLSAAGVITTITETVPSGYILSAPVCTGLGIGGTASFSAGVLTLDAAATIAGSNITCVFTNTRIPTVSIQKTTVGGFGGPFAFVQTGLVSGPAPISTTATGVASPSTPTPINATIGTAVSLNEGIAPGYQSSGITCIDANSATTTNPAISSITSAITIPAGNIKAGTAYNCLFTNFLILPQLAVNKSANLANTTAAGQVISYTIAVSNTGNVTIAAITVTDPRGTVVCAVSGNATIASLAPGASQNCTLAYAVTQNDFNTNGGGTGKITNTATAVGSYGATAVSANGTANVTIVLNPALSTMKTASPSGPVGVGAAITYTYKVTNTGNVTMSGVSVTDAHNGTGVLVGPGNELLLTDSTPIGDSIDTSANGSWDTLAPGDIVSFKSTYTVTQQDVDSLQ